MIHFGQSWINSKVNKTISVDRFGTYKFYITLNAKRCENNTKMSRNKSSINTLLKSYNKSMKIDAVFYLSVHFQMSFSFINEKLISIVLLNLLSAEFQRDLN